MPLGQPLLAGFEFQLSFKQVVFFKAKIDFQICTRGNSIAKKADGIKMNYLHNAFSNLKTR